MTGTKITTFWSAAGGVGKTTLSIIHAQELARRGEKVALLDFTEARPAIYKILGLPFLSPDKVLPVIEEKPVATEKIFAKKGNLHVFTGVSLKQFEMFQEEHFATIIRAAKIEFQNIIIDTNAGIFFSATAAALKASDEINVVLRPDILCLKDTAAMINFLCQRWGIKRSRFLIYLNHMGIGDIDRETVESILGQKTVEVYLKRGKILNTCANKKSKKGFFNLIERMKLVNVNKSI